MASPVSSALLGVCQFVVTLFLIVYYILQSIVLMLIPWRLWHKDVSSATVLITGGGSGIGRELAIQFSRLSSKIVLLDINAADLKRTADEIREDGSTRSSVHTYVCDVSDYEEVLATADKIRKEVGTVSILINNAGIVAGETLLDMTEKAIKKTIAVNTLAHFWTCKAFLPGMIKQKHGHIVSIASMAGYVFPPKLTEYCASKAAAVAFMESLREEMKTQGHDYIRLTLVAPYHVSTRLFEGFKALIPSFTPQYIAGDIVNGILSNQEFMTAPSFLSFLIPIVGILPHKALRELHKFTGLYTCMDNFKGKKP